MEKTYQFVHGHLTETGNILHRGMFYGDGFFESMRWYDGKILLRELHEQRIRKCAELLALELGNFNSLEHIEKTISESETSQHLRIRVVIIRSGKGFYFPEENKADIFIHVQKLESVNSLNEKGYNIGIFEDQTKSAGKLSSVKSTSALLYVMASIKMKQSLQDEIIILNSAGNICEGSSTNIFIVKKNQIFTPTLSEGCIDGVFRRYLIDLLQLSGYDIEERSIAQKELFMADEVWFTSSIRGLQWTATFEQKRYTNDLAKKVQQLIFNQLYNPS